MKNTQRTPLIKFIMLVMTIVMLVQMISVSALAEKPTTTWSLEGWRIDAPFWIKGNLFTWYEGDYVPMRLKATTFTATGQTIAVQHDYMDADGAIGIDGAAGWFIGPIVPDTTPYEDVPVLFPVGPDTFVVEGPDLVDTSNGQLIEYRLVPNTTSSFLSDLEAQGDWAIYWRVHMSRTGSINQYDGSTVGLGSGYFAGNSLHSHTSVTGSQDVPIGTQNALDRTSVAVSKTWIGPAAAQAIIYLLADGVPTGDMLVLNDGNGYSGVFSELLVLDENGEAISYTISEEPIPGYSSVISGDALNGFVVVNTIIQTTDIHVVKIWNGPAALQATIRLVADGTPTGAILVLNAGNGYEGSFSGLPVYSNVDGALIVYTITEDAIASYSSAITGSAADGFTVTNTNDETVDIEVVKVWIGPAAEEAVVWLVADGVKTALSLTLDDGNGFAGSFTNLDKYNNVDGDLIVYTIEEDTVPGYSKIITGNAAIGFTVTNTNDETTNVPVRKVWVGPAASQAVVRLFADGSDTGLFLVLNAENEFEDIFTGLDKYNNVDGEMIVYTVEEDAIAGYTSVITGSADNGFTITNTSDETVDIEVDKVWVGPAADEAVVWLVADGVKTALSLTLNDANDYMGSFMDLDKYNNVDGALIVYTIEEDAIADYSSAITGSAAEGFTVTNTNNETVDVPVVK
ncbi:MAG: Cna B-type domain-containing protein, partial [Saccharofermentanales bacterium]